MEKKKKMTKGEAIALANSRANDMATLSYKKKKATKETKKKK